MKTVSTMALGLALAFGMVATPAMAQREKKEKAGSGPAYSAKVRTPAAAAQDAIKANDTATALAKIGEAEAAIANDDDKFLVGNLYVQVGQTTKDNATLTKGLDLMLGSGKVAPDQQAKLYMVQGQIAYQNKDYAKALTAFQASDKAGNTDQDLLPLMVEAQNSLGQPLQALQMLNAGIEKRRAANQPVPQEWYQRGLAFGYRPKGQVDVAALNAETTKLTQSWVAAYPTKDAWHDALAVYGEQAKLEGEAQTDLYRLQRAAGALKGQNEYLEYADNVYLRYPAEAQAVLTEGQTKGVINPAGNRNLTEVMSTIKTKIPADKASLPASDKAARAGANGRTALNTADAYASYGDYAKAAEMYRLAISKGGIDAPTANLRLGAALAQSGDAAGAKQAFAAVTGPRKPIADFWTIHLDHPTAG